MKWRWIQRACFSTRPMNLTLSPFVWCYLLIILSVSIAIRDSKHYMNHWSQTTEINPLLPPLLPTPDKSNTNALEDKGSSPATGLVKAPARFWHLPNILFIMFWSFKLLFLNQEHIQSYYCTSGLIKLVICHFKIENKRQINSIPCVGFG